jgi:TrmH family RNA methyltransferase
VITSRQNEKLRLIRRLADRRHRDREGLFVAEGEDLIAAAKAAGREPEFVLRAGREVAPELLDGVSTLGSGTRVIGVYAKPGAGGGGAAPDQAPDGPGVYLHAIGDPGNVGAIVRSADALLLCPVVRLGPGCADPYSPKAVRASMGSIFRLRVIEGDLESAARPLVALVAHGGPPPDDAPVGTLCLGAEREGLPADVLARCERRWTIPLVPGGAESLNVAAAAAIALGRISSAAPERSGESP